MNVEATSLPVAPAPRSGFQRWLVLVAATIGIVVASYGFTLIWSSAQPTSHQVFYTIALATAVAMFGISWLIAWRAGRSIANLSMALALAAIFMNDTLSVTLLMLGYEKTPLFDAINALTFILGAGLFIRASQYFPRLLPTSI